MSTDYARLHPSNGQECDGGALSSAEFCVDTSPECGRCPNLKALPPIASGVAWLGVTGDATGATYTITGVKADCQACPVADWMTTQYGFSYAGNNATAHVYAPGEAGIKVAITATGSMTIDYDGMEEFPVTGTQGAATISGMGVFGGEQTAVMPLPQSSLAAGPATGTFAAPPNGGVFLTYRVPGYPPTKPIPTEPFGTSGGVQWSCSGNRMTFDASGIATTHWTLNRVAA